MSLRVAEEEFVAVEMHPVDAFAISISRLRTHQAIFRNDPALSSNSIDSPDCTQSAISREKKRVVELSQSVQKLSSRKVFE